MKLEAVDKKHSSQNCVASVADLMDSRILVHFDSWDDVYDYWADASSPYIHPVGWCQQNGHSLTPPNCRFTYSYSIFKFVCESKFFYYIFIFIVYIDYKEPKTFNWESYLKDTRAVAAPARAFKQRPPCGFKRGMKLESVDTRMSQLIRVATIEDVKDHQ